MSFSCPALFPKPLMNKLQIGILKTLAYADVFNYPLKSDEIDRFLVSDSPESPSGNLTLLLVDLIQKRLIENEKDFYFLPGRKENVKNRLQKAAWSESKFDLARRAAVYLAKIPFIRMVGITGSLAMANSDREDDIDLLVITDSKRLWLTRFLTILATDLHRQRRHPGQNQVKDALCLNMFLDLDHLTIPDEERNLYIAHEITQVRVIFDRSRTFPRFLQANSWVTAYLPNAFRNVSFDLSGSPLIGHQYPVGLNGLLNQFEKLIYLIQLKWMRRHRTNEVTGQGRARFHPFDCTLSTLAEYQKRLKQHHLS
jgi:hypothetical protein